VSNYNLSIERHWSVKSRREVQGCYTPYISPLCTYLNTYWPDYTEWDVLKPGYGPGVLQGRQTGRMELPAPSSCPDAWTKTLTRLTFTAADGTQYELRDKLSNGEPLYSTLFAGNPNGGASRGRVFATADGTSATFISDTEIRDSWGACQVSPNSSQNYMIYPTGYLLLRDGTRYRIVSGQVGWIRDRNGNVLTFSDTAAGYVITDSLNRQVIISDATTNPLITIRQIKYSGLGGVQRTITIEDDNTANYLRADYRPGGANYVPGGDLPGGGGYKSQAWLFPGLNGASNSMSGYKAGPTSVILPDDRRYRFYYNPYGELARVELPTGGVFEYDWEGGVNTHVEPDGRKTGLVGNVGIYRRVVERRVYVDGTTLSERTRYTEDANLINTTGNSAIKVEQLPLTGTTPLATSVHTFNGSAVKSLYPPYDPTSYEYIKNGREHKTEQYASDGITLLRRVEQTWQSRVTYTWAEADLRLIETTSTLADGNLVSKQTYAYSPDEYNNQTDVWEYDYGAGTPGALVRHTQTDFKTDGYDTLVGGVSNPNAAATLHLRSLPKEQVVYDAQGLPRAKTTYLYDNEVFNPLGALQNLANVPGLVDRLGQPYTAGNPATNDQQRGNPIKVSRWLLATTGPEGNDREIAAFSRYDVVGNVIATQDAKGAVTQIGYSATFAYAYPTSTTSPVPDSTGQFGSSASLTTAVNYDFSTGKILATTDANGQTTTLEYHDPLDRLTRVVRPLGETSYVYGYGDGAGNRYLATQTRQSGSTMLHGYAFYDGLGRTWRTAHYEGQFQLVTARWSISDTKYDALGRVSQTSNPYCAQTGDLSVLPSANTLGLCSSETAGVQWTTTTYDALSRVTSVTTPDSAHVDTAYLGNKVTVTDQVGKQRSSQTDALGRLVQVNEAPNVSTVNYQTNYTYDVLNNLIRVRQGGFPLGESGQTVQFRRFYYDSLARLVYANNPEQEATIAYDPPGEAGTKWTMKYVYDDNGNLSSRTDARNVTATYTYDALNRNKQVSYTDGTPTVKRCYDIVNPAACADGQALGTTFPLGLGRARATLSFNTHPLTTWKAHSRTVINGYDALGRATGQRQGFWHSVSAAVGSWVDYPVSRTYDLANHPLVQTYPSGRTTTNTYNAGGRLTDYWGTLGPDSGFRFYAAGVAYNAAGQLITEQFGTTESALYHTIGYNHRLQMVETRLGASLDWSITQSWNRGRLLFYHSDTARTQNNPWLAAPDNNGNVSAQEHQVPVSLGPFGQVTSSVVTQRDDYHYDEVNRLDWVEGWQWQANPGWQQLYKQTFLYDKFGNRRINTTASATWGNQINNVSYDISQVNNRVQGARYDSTGNVLKSESPELEAEYDAENRMNRSSSLTGRASYLYDGEGRRVRKIVGEGSPETWFVYGMDGELLAEYPSNGTVNQPWTEYGYRNGQLLIVAGCDMVRWLVPDQLGTPRLEVEPSGSLAGVKRHDYLPFGEELYVGMGGGVNGVTPLRSAGLGYTASLAGDCVRQRFGSYERDNETGLDFAQARYFNNVQGRFTSPDPFNPILQSSESTFVGWINDPRRWNKYAYALNNPLKYVDQDGENPTALEKAASRLVRLVAQTGGHLLTLPAEVALEGLRILLDIGENRRLKPAFLAAFFAFDDELFEFEHAASSE
jgi:RHS repeat-associated protein